MNDVKEMVTSIVENPAIINWDYFFKYGFDGEHYKLDSEVIEFIIEVMPEDSRLCKRLLNVVKKISTDNITYDFLVNVLCKLIVSMKGVRSIETYFDLSNRLYDCTDYIPYLGTDLDSLNVSIRAYNCLKRHGCNTVDDVIAVIKENKLHEVRNIGEKAIKEVIEAVEKWKIINKRSDK